MAIVYNQNWNDVLGLQAKYGNQYDDDYNTLGAVGWQQMSAMLITWANRELKHNHAVYLRDLAIAIKDPQYNATVQLGFHQWERFNNVDYFHITVLNPFGPTVHLFSKVTNWFGNIPTIEKSFCGGSTSPNRYEERYYYGE